VTRGTGLPFDEPPAPPPARRVVSVSELTATLRDLVETRFAEIWVEGELSGAKVWNTGHLYFTLKDAHAQVKGVMFRSSLRLLRFKPVDGVHVVARGRLSVYDPRGEYQLVCEHMEPRGLGALQLAYEQLRARLAAEGLFDQARKRPLPALPRRIGVVTSIEGAALRDIIRVLRRRYPNAHVIVAPARVQGEGAARDIARAIRQVTRIDAVDVVIAGRGGGSIEDLWAFNEEAVARAIAASPVPVISAVGHETDVTIADFVADLRAPTPSAAAELVVRRKDEFAGHIDALAQRAAAALGGRLQRLAGRLHQLQARPAFAGLPARIAFRHRHVADLTAALRRGAGMATAERRRRLDAATRALALHHPQQRLGRGRATLATQDRRLAAAIARRRHAADTRLRETAAHLHALSPLAVLGRGYAMCWTDDRTTLVRTAAALAPGARVHVRLASGEIGCDVREVRPEPSADIRPGTTE
jgi:exodeoxyribonuclease VII large subunit